MVEIDKPIIAINRIDLTYLDNLTTIHNQGRNRINFRILNDSKVRTDNANDSSLMIVLRAADANVEGRVLVLGDAFYKRFKVDVVNKVQQNFVP